jgi:hypothetical protein
MCSISLAAVEGRSAANYKEALHPSSARFTAVRGILYSQELIAITAQMRLVPALKSLCLRHKGAVF